jgi:hypothetical protein
MRKSTGGATLPAVVARVGDDTPRPGGTGRVRNGFEGYGVLVVDAFQAAGRRLGLRVAGRVRWDPDSRSCGGLARRIKQRGADLVFVSGVIHYNAGTLVRDLRAVLGRRVDLMAPDGLARRRRASTAAGGGAARIVPRHPPGIPCPPSAPRSQVRRALRPNAARRRRALRSTRRRPPRRCSTPSAGPNGSRPCVLAELFRTDALGRLVGDISIDRRGDVKQAAETVVRVVESDDPATSIGSTAGGVVEHVIHVAPGDAE